MELSNVYPVAYLRGSKHGELVRGVVRDDGRIFWAYQNGREMWLKPDRYADYVEAQRRSHEKNAAAGASEAMQEWRRANPGRAKELIRKYAESTKGVGKMRRLKESYDVLVGALDEGKERRRGGIVVKLSPKRAGELAEWLRCIEEA